MPYTALYSRSLAFHEEAEVFTRPHKTRTRAGLPRAQFLELLSLPRALLTRAPAGLWLARLGPQPMAGPGHAPPQTPPALPEGGRGTPGPLPQPGRSAGPPPHRRPRKRLRRRSVALRGPRRSWAELAPLGPAPAGPSSALPAPCGRPGQQPPPGPERVARRRPGRRWARTGSWPSPALPRGLPRRRSGLGCNSSLREPRAPLSPHPTGPLAAAMPDEPAEPGRASLARASSFLIENLLAAEAKRAGRGARGGREDHDNDGDDDDDDDPEDERVGPARRRRLPAGSGSGGEARARALLRPGAIGLGPRPPPGPGQPYALGGGGSARWCPRARGGYGGGPSPDRE